MQHCIIYWQWCGGACFFWWLNSRNSRSFHPVVPPFATGMGSLHSAGGPRTSCGSFVMLNRAATQSFVCSQGSGCGSLLVGPFDHALSARSMETFFFHIQCMSCPLGVVMVDSELVLSGMLLKLPWAPARVPDSCLRAAAWFRLNYDDLRWHHF